MAITLAPYQSDPLTSTVTASLIVHDDFSHISQALQCLYANTAYPMRVVVTINRDAADAARSLSNRFPDMTMIVNPVPKGFASNHNAVLRVAETPFIALINDDALVQPGALDALLDYLGSHPDCGMVGPQVVNPDGTPQISAFSDPTLFRMVFRISGLSDFTKQGSLIRRFVQWTGITQWMGVESLKANQRTRIVPVLVGVCMVVRREAIQQAGLMDEDTLVYGEEFGWQRRLREKGWNAALVSEAQVVHLNTTQDLTGWKLAEHRKGMMNYFIRYKPRWQSFVLRAALVFFHGLYALVWLPVNTKKASAHRQSCLVGLKWRPAQ